MNEAVLSMPLREFAATNKGVVIKASALDGQLIGLGTKPDDGRYSDLIWYSAKELAYIIASQEKPEGLKLLHAVKKHGLTIEKTISGGTEQNGKGI